MLSIVVLILIAVAAYAGFREGLFTAFLMLINAFLAGLVAFNFFEPIADLVEPVFKGGVLAGYEDFLALTLLYALSLILLRVVTNNIANRVIEFPSHAQQFGGAGVGALTGYFMAGFLLCTLHTLPWHERFMDFEPRNDAETGPRTVWPPDRAWLSMMRYAGAHVFSWKQANPRGATRYDRFQTFDADGTFELRYQRHRRYTDQGPAKPSQEWPADMDRRDKR